MILAIDASSAIEPEKTGVHWYAYHLIEALKNTAVPPEWTIELWSDRPLPEPLSVLPPGWTSRVLRWPMRIGWMQGRVAWEILCRPPDVLFIPAKAIPWNTPRPNGKRRPRVITTIHDLGSFTVPEAYPASVRRRVQQATRRAAHRASTIFVPSKTVQKEFIALFSKTDASRIVVSPLGVDHQTYKPKTREEMGPVLTKYRLSPQRYFLFVGRLATHKNVPLLIRAFEQFKADRGTGDPYQLILVGRKEDGAGLVDAYLKASTVASFIRELGYVPQEEIPALMSGACAFVFPSKSEGFSLTPLEAAACGTLLIVSDIPVHREVLGDAALFASPLEPAPWAVHFKKITGDESLRASLQSSALARAQEFTWFQAAEDLLSLTKGDFSSIV